MLIVLALCVIVIAPVVCLALLAIGFRAREFFLLFFLSSIALYLSRFDHFLAVTIRGRGYTTFHWYLLSAVFVLFVWRTICQHRPPLHLLGIIALAVLFACQAVLSGVFNGGSLGFFSSVHVLVTVLLPLVVAALCVDVMPRTAEGQRRLRQIFILICGVAIPSITLASALAPNLFGSVLGWSTIRAARSTGFVRGWSPLGSPIITGMTMLLAYGLAVHEVIGNRRYRYIIVLMLVATAALFTLSRSLLVMIMPFHLIYFAITFRRHFSRMVLIGAAICIVLAPLLWTLGARYSFERFLQYGGASTELRMASAEVAFAVGLQNPILGQGPGLLYKEIRTASLGGTGHSQGNRPVTFIDGRISALEPHNLYLLLVAEHGWPAAFVFVGVLLMLWKRIWLDRHHLSASDQSMRAAMHGLWVSIFAMLLTSSGPLVNAQASVFFWLFAFIGLHWRVTGDERRVGAKKWVGRRKPPEVASGSIARVAATS